MSYKVLEVNVDDLGFGGVYSLVKNVITNKTAEIKIDIAAIEKFCKKENLDYLRSHKTNVFYIGFDGNKLLKQYKCMKNLIELIKKEQYDCVHIHSDVAYKMLVCAMASKKAGVKKIILHSHASGVDGNHRAIKVLYHKLCCRFLKQFGTHFASCSDLATKWMFPNISNEKVILVKNGVDLEKFRFNREIRKQARMELGLQEHVLLGHVGRFAYQKNHSYLIDIFSLVKKQIPSAKLLLIGEGDLIPQMQEKVKRLNLEDDVIFYGITNSVEILFQAMDIFVLPSHFEGLPIVGVEAQAAGLPVLFSDKITQEAKLLSTTKHIPIGEQDLQRWCDSIKKASELERVDSFQELKHAGYSIQDTVNGLIKLYLGGHKH